MSSFFKEVSSMMFLRDFGVWVTLSCLCCVPTWVVHAVGSRRLPLDQLDLPKIPVQTVSAAVARELLGWALKTLLSSLAKVPWKTCRLQGRQKCLFGCAWKNNPVGHNPLNWAWTKLVCSTKPRYECLAKQQTKKAGNEGWRTDETLFQRESYLNSWIATLV